MKDLVIVKYGEIGLKGANRPRFESALLQNLRWMLRDVPGARVHRERGRFRVEAADARMALSRVCRVFGVVGASVARAVPLDMDAIQEAGADLLREGVGRGQNTFKVQARRANKSFPVRSPELNSRLGAYLLAACPGTRVDVHDPAITVYVEVRDAVAYVYSDTLKGPGGLPVGVSSRGLLLISGGIDSPVAGWLAMRRGIQLAGLHFHAIPFTSERAKHKVLELMEILAAYAGDIPLYMVHFTEAQTAIRDKAPAPLMMTLMRRLMLRVAAQIAAEKGIPALITGESVGQVASQTLHSMAAINAVTNMPILRPLVAADKTEIVSLARRIGTYETSVLPFEDCCTLFVPRHPETHPSLQAVLRAEADLDIDAMVSACLESTETIVVKPHPAASLYEGGPLTFL